MLVEMELGGVAPTITGDHQNRITDYTAIALEIYEDDEDTDREEILRMARRRYFGDS